MLDKNETSDLSLRSANKWDSNPFTVKTLEAVSASSVIKKRFAMGNKSSKAVILSMDTSEIIGETALVTHRVVDTEVFTKVFVKNIGKWSGMGKSTMEVFKYLLNKLEVNKDVVHVYEAGYLSGENRSKASFYRGMGWLIANEFIAKTTIPHFYYINPTLFFNGNRLTLVDVWEKSDTINELNKL